MVVVVDEQEETGESKCLILHAKHQIFDELFREERETVMELHVFILIICYDNPAMLYIVHIHNGKKIDQQEFLCKY